jgi:hypothetical protein
VIVLKRLFVTFILIISVASNAFAGGNLSLFNQTKKTIAPAQGKEDTKKARIKNLRRLTVEDLNSPSPATSEEDDDEDNPWDDGEDMGC